MYKILTAAIILSLPFATTAKIAEAKTSEEILASGETPEKIGLAIAVESDERDFGYGDMEVDIEMILSNSNGQSSKREMRNQTFEMADKNTGDKTLIIFDRPKDVKGTAFLTFSNILEPDDQWLYLPDVGKVKRISSKNKSGPFVGSEFAFEDISSQEVGKYSYKYLKNEPCGKLECFVVDRIPLYEYSGYTKMTSWIDTKDFQVRKVDFYDRKNSLLKTLTYEDYKQYLGKYWRAGKFLMKNHQNGKSTDLHWNNYKFRVGLKERDLTKAKLINAK
jgi:hypothetical protein